MPFDGTNEPDLSVPSLANLAYVLRHKETWPRGFRWDYCVEEQCAFGLAMHFWDYDHIAAGYRQAPAGVRLHIPKSIYNRVRLPGLGRLLGPYGKSFVRPEHVADAIDRLLARQ